jgi:UDPglucose 6-dehydrogenase
MVLKNVKNKNLFFTTELHKALQDSEIAFIAVGTPMGDDGSADLQYVLAVAKSIGQSMQKRLIVVDKSTVPIGTADKVKAVIQKELDLRCSDLEFDVVSNPEFLKEGAAIADFMKPDRVVVGTDSDYASEKMKQLYNAFCMSRDRFISMDIRSAEMTKYAANAMLATKISFMNEIANICEKVGADANQVRIGIGSDQRIGYSFIYPGAGYGGSCFPKDVKALQKAGKDVLYNFKILNSVIEVNEKQKTILYPKIEKYFKGNLLNKKIAIWGLAFKPETDDVREAPAIYLINKLLDKGALLSVYDPEAMPNIEKQFGDKLNYSESMYNALEDADALVICTEWSVFRTPDFDKVKNLLNQNIIFDGRNLYEIEEIKKEGFLYYSIGRR